MFEWRINGRSLEIEDPVSGSWNRLCDAFGISRVEVDLLTGIHEIVLYVDSVRGGLNTMRVRREDLKKSTIMSRLYQLGLSLLDGDEDIPIVQQILLESELNAPLAYHHDRLGFAGCDGKEVFLLDKPIGSIDPLKAGSSYAIPTVMEPRGSVDEWREVVEKEVVGHPALELALAVGALAPIAHLLRTDGTITDLPVVAYIGPSTSGKTSALRVGASIWGFPMESVGIIDDLNTTENAFFESLARNVGVPAFIDETSAQAGWDFQRMIYFLPKGRSKRRCDPSGELKRTSVFSGAVVFTGERSLVERADQNSGLRARIIELKIDKWTENAEHAEHLTEGLCRKYGTAAPLLMAWLIEHKNDLPSLYRAARERLINRTRELNAIEFRALKIHAMILVAADAVRESLDLPLDAERIQELVVEQMVRNHPECDEISCIYYDILESIAENGSKFTWPTKKGVERPQGKDVWGLFEFRKSTPCIWIGLKRFQAMLKACSDRELKDIARALVERKWLADLGSRHYYRSRKINGIPINAVCLLLPEAPGLFDRLENLSSNASSRELSMALRGDTFESTVLSGQAEADRTLREAVGKETAKMACGFAYPCAQSEAFLINRELAAKLTLKDGVFVTVLADEKAFLLSTDPLAAGSLRLPLSQWNGLKICKNSSIVQALMNTIDLSLEIGRAVAITDVDVQSKKKGPIAVVGSDFETPIGMIAGAVTGWALPTEMEEGSASESAGQHRRKKMYRSGILCDEPDNEESQTA